MRHGSCAQIGGRCGVPVDLPVIGPLRAAVRSSVAERVDRETQPLPRVRLIVGCYRRPVGESIWGCFSCGFSVGKAEAFEELTALIRPVLCQVLEPKLNATRIGCCVEARQSADDAASRFQRRGP